MLWFVTNSSLRFGKLLKAFLFDGHGAGGVELALLIHLLTYVHIQYESKKYPPKTFCSIFTHVKYISVKFCLYVASLYLHKSANFG